MKRTSTLKSPNFDNECSLIPAIIVPKIALVISPRLLSRFPFDNMWKFFELIHCKGL